MFFELREYRTLPGKRDDWVRFMEDLVIPYQMSKGMAILGSFVAEEEDDLYVWIRRFESEEERLRLRERSLRDRLLEDGDRTPHPADVGSTADQGNADRGYAQVVAPLDPFGRARVSAR